ncbi:hypothetical protein LTR27_002875 [Elasticomyces elasticus]|nr:hypothetical protein LTR27_002875 [Elasticomyces elasticus]
MSLTNKHEAQEALIHDSPEDDHTKPRLRDSHSKWKTTVSIGAGLATGVLAINIAILAWTKSSFSNKDGMATVFEGSCDVAEKAVLGADLAINVLSTLLLGASNHNAQLLSAPTRSDVDRQHSRGIWLDIGVSSVRNFRYLPRWRLTIWTVLVLSTVPLHLLYNSVAFTTRSAVDYQAALVTEDFMEGSCVYSHTAAAEIFDLAWPCGNITGCDTNSLLAASESWTISKVPGSPRSDHNSISYNLVDGSDDTAITYDALIKYCLAETFPAHCAVHISSKLLIAVIVCNVLKIACMLATLCARRFRPLVNIGDAVASFLERPDPKTSKNGALEVGLVSSGVWRNFDRYAPMPWTQHRRQWFYAVPRIQLYLTFFL